MSITIFTYTNDIWALSNPIAEIWQASLSSIIAKSHAKFQSNLDAVKLHLDAVKLHDFNTIICLNSLRPSDAYMRS